MKHIVGSVLVICALVVVQDVKGKLQPRTPLRREEKEMPPFREPTQQLEDTASVLSTEEIRLTYSISGALYRLLRPTFNERLGLALPGFYLKQTKEFVDFMYIVDISRHGFGFTQFHDCREATKAVVHYIDEKSPIAATKSRVGLVPVLSNGSTRVAFTFGDYNTASTTNVAIATATFNYGSPEGLIKALSLARTEFQKSRPRNNTRVVWLAIDSSEPTGTIGSIDLPASSLKDMGVKICVLLIGNQITTSLSQYRSLASPRCFFQLTSFSSYKRVMDHILQNSGGPSPAPTISPTFFTK